MERQFDLFGDRDERPVSDRRDEGEVRRHEPAAGEHGIPLTDPQPEIVDWLLERMAAAEDRGDRAIPVRVGNVLFVPRKLESVADIMDLLDEHLPQPTWSRPAERLAQDLHEWWGMDP